MIDYAYYWLWLSSIYGVSPKVFYNIVSIVEDIERLFKNPDILNEESSIEPYIKANIKKSACKKYLDDLIEKIKSANIKFVTVCDNNYPYFLKNHVPAPPVLYYKGTLPDEWERSVTIVGTRKPTRDGEKSISLIAGELAESGVKIVSGMARGLDSIAQKAALDAGGTTYAILGCGVDIVYPAEHAALYEKIAEKGAVISQFAPGTPPARENFPIRNHIMAGISQAVVAGEAKMRSGVSITVNIASEMGKTIFALPCDISKETSKLPNNLIKNGAHIITCADDLFDEMQWKKEKRTNVSSSFLKWHH